MFYYDILQKQPADARHKKTDAPQPDVKGEEEEEKEPNKDADQENLEDQSEEQSEFYSGQP